MKRHDSHLSQGFQWLEANDYGTAAECFRRARPGLDRDLGLARALLENTSLPEGPQEAYRILLRWVFSNELSERPAFRAPLLDLLTRAAGTADPELAELLRGKPSPPQTRNRKLAVLKAFYFLGALHGQSPGEKVFEADRNLKAAMRTDRTISPDAYTVQFAKKYSSSTPLLDLAPDTAAGGGYFLNLGGLGCVVDPGHDFLKNFYALRLTLFDIDCIIVTHFHDDHYADLPALLSLLYKRSKSQKPANHPVRLLLDVTTFQRFQPLFDGSPHVHATALTPREQRIELNPEIVLRTLPTRHHIVGKIRNTGVGLDFHLKSRDQHLVITSDTAWCARVATAYQSLHDECNVVLIAHVSSAFKDEIIETLARGEPVYYHKHLCIHGLCELIQTVCPTRVILSEIGEELEDVTATLADIISRIYRVETRIGNFESGTHHL